MRHALVLALLLASSPSPPPAAPPNAWLLSLERSVCDAAGIPDQPWFRHLIFAPLPSYRAETLPAIREALVSAQLDVAAREIGRLAGRLDAAVSAARKVAGSPPAVPPRPTPPRR